MIRKILVIASVSFSNAASADEYAKGYGDGFRDGQKACTQMAPELQLGGTIIPKVQSSLRRTLTPLPSQSPSFPSVITPFADIELQRP